MEEINSAESEKEKIRLATEEAIKFDSEAKEKYKAIAKIESVLKNGDRVTCYFKEPNRMAIGAAMAVIERDVMQGLEFIFDGSIIPEISPDWQKFREDSGCMGGSSAQLQLLCGLKKNRLTFL